MPTARVVPKPKLAIDLVNEWCKPQRFFYELVLLLRVHCRNAGSRCRGARAPDVVQGVA